MLDRRPFRALTGHLVCPVPPVLGWYLVEDAPGSQCFNFGFQPAAREVMREHNRLWRKKHGDAAADAEDKAHAELCERVREINRERGFTDAEIDAAWNSYDGARAIQTSIF